MLKFIPSTGGRRLLGACALFTLSAFAHDVVAQAPPAPAPAVKPAAAAPTPTTLPMSPPTPTPKPTPTPVPHHYAPAGIYYVVEDISVRLPAGILGVLAGQQVRLIKDNGETLHVTDGHDEFDVKSFQVTNDLDIAAVVLKNTQSTEAADAQVRAAQEAQLVKQQQAQMEYLRAHPLTLPTPPESSPHR